MPAMSRLMPLLAVCACVGQVANAAPANLGLNPNALTYGGVAVGFIPGWGEPMYPSTPSTLNAVLPKPMALVGAYAQIKASDPNMTQLDNFVEATLAQPGKPILQLALMPDEGLGNITQAVCDRIANKFAQINAKGLTVWVRYAHEMNGDWYVWGRQADAFISTWRMLTTAIRAKAPQTYMNWSPNSLLGDSVDDKKGYTMYFPGKEYVDMVGLSWYHFGGQYRSNVLPDPGEALGTMKQFDGIYGSGGMGLPMILSETAASYTTILQTGLPESGGAREYDIKKQWLYQLLSCQTLKQLPLLKAITWFEVIKDETAAGNTEIKNEDFRIISSTNTTLIRDAAAFLGSTVVPGAFAMLAKMPGTACS